MAKTTENIETVESPDIVNEVQAQLDAVKAELAVVIAENERLKAEISGLSAQLAQVPAEATLESTQPAGREDDEMLVCAANGTEFWRCGILFTGQWQIVKRADVGEEAWERILDEAMLKTKKVK